MEKTRCPWAANNEWNQIYHDTEWGVPLHDDTKLFEFLILDAFQAGLSWLTILKKRENFRKAFDNFDANIIATYSENKGNRHQCTGISTFAKRIWKFRQIHLAIYKSSTHCQ
jgi:DNA-3-methyladenine glycosylase I